ncbi:MAG: DUF131 domain-containing protein [Candidatus Thermoplasmatota archaeon]|nr:DUF131 domain-containing protein [Candidatus Thermoplasmatota archaeon]
MGIVAGGIASLLYGGYLGQASLHLLLVFPVVTATGFWGFAGSILLFGGSILLFFSFVHPNTAMTDRPWEKQNHDFTEKRPRVRTGGVVLIGPVPIMWGSDGRMALLSLLASILMVIILLGLAYGYLWG